MPPKLTIRAVHARPVNVPLRRPLVTASGEVRTAPLVLIDLQSEEGVTGSSYIFCVTEIALAPVAQLLTALNETLRGHALAPSAIDQSLQMRFRLLGPQGLTGMAMAGIDMAAWDAVAKACGLPLVRVLGGEPRAIPTYNSCGLGMIGAERAPDEARELAAGFSAIKVRIGYLDANTDLAVVRAVRQAVGPAVRLMTDYNQCLTTPEAIARGARLDDEGLDWIEEPTIAFDFAGHANIARRLRTPVQLGENWWGPHDMNKSIAAGASDLAMTDAVRIGGVTGWLRAASLAEAAGLPLSSHLFPEISAHLLAVTPTCHWLEYVDWADPILCEPVRVDRGAVAASDRPGIGIAWNEAAIKHSLY